MSYVNVAFQSPMSNPNFKLKYTFKKDRSGTVAPLVEMDFDAEPLASTIVHTIVLRCSILITESLSMGPELMQMLGKKNEYDMGMTVNNVMCSAIKLARIMCRGESFPLERTL